MRQHSTAISRSNSRIPVRRLHASHQMWTCSKCSEECEDTFDVCWSCGTSREGKPPAEPFVSEASQPVPEVIAIRSDEQTPQEFIDAVRLHTCYSVLRSLIDLFSLLSIIVMVAAGLSLVSSQVMIGVAVIVIAMGCFMVIAGRQSALLLVDIADTLIEQNRKKGRESKDAT